MFQLFLFLHVLAAIVAFGPTFAFPLIGAMGGKEPMHGNFAVRINEKLEDRLVLPFALTMPVTGVLMIATFPGGIDMASSAAWWLDIAIVLYVIAMVIAIFIQRPTVQRMVHMSAMAAAGSPGPGAAPAGPPPQFLADVKASARNGMIMSVLLLAIILLMVFRPTF